MKNIMVKFISLSLVLLMLVTCFASCSSLGKPLLELDKTELSENVYMLFLSRLKGTLASGVNYGSSALKDSFWDQVVTSDGKTREESYKEQILEECKFYVAALNLYDELGLKLPDSYTEEIEQTLKDYVDIDAEGSKTAFNAILAPYGANYKVLREALMIEAKLAYLNEYLYGADGSKIGHEIKDSYYKENYVRFKHIFFYTYDVIYETDSEGNDIYYSDTSKKKIAYDTTALKKRNTAGEEVKDKNGDIVYVDANGKIAYDKTNGQRIPLYDENGYVKTENFTKDELNKVNADADVIFNQLVGQQGNYTLFDAYVEELSEDEGSLKYTNGFYMTRDTNYEAPEVLEAVCEMECGEIRKVYSDLGIHIVMKYELEENGYALTENSDFFVKTGTDEASGTLIFVEKLKTTLLMQKLAPSISEVKVHTDRYDAISIKALEPNFYY